MAQIQAGKNYIITNVASGTVVDLDDGKPGNEVPINGWSLMVKADDSQQHQIWTTKLEDATEDGKWYSFTNIGTGTRIDNIGGRADPGNPIQGYEAHEKDTNQQWLAFPVKKGAVQCYVFYNRTPWIGRDAFCCMDLLGGGTANRTPILLQKGSKTGSNDNQMWMLTEIQ